MHIAIIGAGIGGLSSAALLAGDGHRVAVFDRFETPRPVGSGVVIQPVGLAVLAQMGVDVSAQGAALTRLLGHEIRHGHKVLDVRYCATGRRHGLAIHRASLFNALLHAAQAAGAEIYPNRAVIAVNLGHVLCANGADAGPFDLVVDASGARSALSPICTRPLPFGALWGSVDWPCDSPLPDDQLTQRYLGAAKMLGVMPIGRRPGSQHPAAAIFYSLPAGAEIPWRNRPLGAWQDEVAQLWPDFAPFARQITTHDQMTMARYAHGTLRRPWSSGLVHIGDAAHQTSPQLGQGANMALLDALALAVCLRSGRGDAALADYAAMRRWHVRIYQGFSRAFTPQYQSHSRVLPVLRDRILAPLSQMPPLPAILSRLVRGDILPPLAGVNL